MGLTQITGNGLSENINIDSNTLKVDGTNNRVGIGTSSPAAKLDVNGNVRFGDGGGFDMNINGTRHQFSIGGTERMRIDSSGKVGIGTTSPNFKLDVNGEVGITEGQALTWHDGSGGRSAQIYGGSGDVLVFRNTSSLSERMRIDSSGNVGIGTSSPGARLEVVGSNAANNLVVSAGNTDFAVYNNDSTGEVRLVAEDGSTNNNSKFLTLYTQASGASSPTERMRIDSSGRVGIGTTSPNTDGRFTVSDARSEVSYVSFENTQNYGWGVGIKLRMPMVNGGSAVNSGKIISGWTANNQSYMAFKNYNGSEFERMRIDSSGRLLVGTTITSQAVRALFQASSGGTGGGVVMISRGTATPSNQQGLGEILFADSGHVHSAKILAGRDSGTWTSGSSQPTFIKFNTTPNSSATSIERMRIFGTGQTHHFTADNGFVSASAQNAGTTYWLFRGIRSRTSNTAGGATVFYVYSNGNVQNTNNSYGSISDVKLKENIVDATSQWDDLKALQVRKYNFIEGETHTQLGVIAQEVETVSPGLVKDIADRDEEGNDLGTVTKTVNYSVLYMKAVKALQEAMERIETLEAKVAALEAAQ